MNRVNALLFSLLIFSTPLAGCIGGEDVDTSEDSLKPETYRENLTEIDKPREMSIYYGYPNRVNNAPQFDVSEVQRKTILGDVEFDMRTGEWELIRGNEKL